MSVTHRAYSLVQFKSVDDDQRILTGIATTPSTDRMEDVVEPKGAKFALPVPLLWQHRSDQPIGQVIAAKITNAGIEVKAQIAKGLNIPRIDEAWALIKAGLVRGLSIGFRALEDPEPIKGTYGLRFTSWEWLELSAVTIPANADANIFAVKTYDLGVAAAIGSTPVVRLTTNSMPRDRGDFQRSTGSPGCPPMKTTAEKITAFEAEKAAKLEKMNALAGADDGATMDASAQEEFDTLEKEIGSIDGHIARLKKLQEFNKAHARPVNGSTTQDAGDSRGTTPVIRVSDRLEKGQRFARFAMCMMVAKGSRSDALMLAKQHYQDDPAISGMIEKAAVTTGTTADGGGPILQYQDVIDDFVAYLRPGSILGKFGQNGIPPLHRVGFNTRTVVQTGAASAYWVGQGKPKPLTKATFSTVTVDFTKVANIAVLTKEEVRFVPSSEMRVRDELARAINARIDQDFIDPTNAGSAGVKPASILNGIAAGAASGTNAAAVQTDLASLFTNFATANLEPVAPVLIMSKSTAIALSMMLTSLGSRQYPDLTINGGTINGIPVIVSQYLNSLGSPGTGMVVLVDANEIFLADDGNVTISASDQASVEMLDGSLVQDATAGTGTSLVSLWQSNLLGLLAEREISWKLARAGVGAYYLSNVAYAA